jgi:hypothetical protein
LPTLTNSLATRSKRCCPLPLLLPPSFCRCQFFVLSPTLLLSFWAARSLLAFGLVGVACPLLLLLQVLLLFQLLLLLLQRVLLFLRQILLLL